MQAKQELLLQRANQLDQECEDLQNRLTEMEEDKENLENECEAMKCENELVAKKSVDLQVSYITCFALVFPSQQTAVFKYHL